MSGVRPETRSARTRPEPHDIVQPQRAVAGVGEQVAHRGSSDDRRAVRGHRAQTGPELGLREITAIGEEVVHGMLEGSTSRRAQALAEADQLGRSPPHECGRQDG